MKSIFLTFLFIVFACCLFAQSTNSTLDQQEQKITIDSICAKLKANYIFPDVALQMNKLITNNFKKNEYKSITNPNEFAERLTNDLRSISKDLHLRVIYAPDQIAEQKNAVSDKEREALENQMIKEMKQNNFGFKEIKILNGNIGYLDLRGFLPPEYGGETAVAAMSYLSNADALIIDLRQNGGGSPGMIQLISSYLFGSEPVHLNNFYRRPSNEYTQSWTFPYVQGKRRPDRDVYVLTSKRTFSAAEEFSYNLKNLKRATLIGETTGGGAHPGGTVNVTDKFMVWIPKGRAINPITNTNWEGTGVTPDIEVSADRALIVAQIKALKSLQVRDSSRTKFFQWFIEEVESSVNPIIVAEEILKSYVGRYKRGAVTYEDGKLVLRLNDGPRYFLIPMTKELFRINEIPDI